MNLKGWTERFREGKAGPWLWALLAVMVLLALVTGTPKGNASVSRQEARIAQVLSLMEGAGRVETALFYPEETSGLWQEETRKVPTGAVIVAEGADRIEVRLRLTRAASALLGLEMEKIGVFPMEKGE